MYKFVSLFVAVLISLNSFANPIKSLACEAIKDESFETLFFLADFNINKNVDSLVIYDSYNILDYCSIGDVYDRKVVISKDSIYYNIHPSINFPYYPTNLLILFGYTLFIDEFHLTFWQPSSGLIYTFIFGRENIMLKDFRNLSIHRRY